MPSPTAPVPAALIGTLSDGHLAIYINRKRKHVPPLCSFHQGCVVYNHHGIFYKLTPPSDPVAERPLTKEDRAELGL